MTAQPSRPSETLDVFLVAGEESGDRLGAALMRALRERAAERCDFAGVGGREMAAEGVASLYSDRRSRDHRLQRDPAADSEDPASLIRDTAEAVVARAARTCW